MYRIEIRRSAFRDLERVPSEYKRLIANHINGLQGNPHPSDSKKLKGDAGYSLRIGTYRVLYDIDNRTKLVTIYRIKHRREVYR